MSIPSTGFCIHLQRQRQEKRPAKNYARTVGEYRCFLDGVEIATLAGQMVEREGLGDNTKAIGNLKDRRIEAGTYPLAVQQGERFWTHGYHQSASHTGAPKPGLLLKRTKERVGILIHPGMDYVWSVGCLNPASGLDDASSGIKYTDSRAQVIAIIEFLRGSLGKKFPKAHGETIPGAVIVIEGEPT